VSVPEGIQPLLIIVAATLVAMAGVWLAVLGVRDHDRFALWTGSAVFVACSLVVALFLSGPS
jgi:hypothetical protein